MVSLTTYARGLVPVIQKASTRGDLAPRIEPPEVGLRWGAPSALKFTLDPGQDLRDDSQDPNVVVVDLNEYDIFRGTKETYRKSFELDLYITEAGNLWAPMVKFTEENSNFCQKTIIEREETVKSDAITTIVQPIREEIEQYLTWNFAPKFDDVFPTDSGEPDRDQGRGSFKKEPEITGKKPKPKKTVNGKSKGPTPVDSPDQIWDSRKDNAEDSKPKTNNDAEKENEKRGQRMEPTEVTPNPPRQGDPADVEWFNTYRFPLDLGPLVTIIEWAPTVCKCKPEPPAPEV